MFNNFVFFQSSGKSHMVQGLSIMVNAGSNFAFGEDVPVTCHNDVNGIVIQFAFVNSTDYENIAECQFDVEPQLMSSRLKEQYTVTQSCVLNIRQFDELDCGTYRCAVLFNKTQSVSQEVLCTNGSAHVAPALNNDEEHTKTEVKDCIIISISLGSVLFFTWVGVCVWIIRMKCKNKGDSSDTVTPEELMRLDEKDTSYQDTTPKTKYPDIRRELSFKPEKGSVEKLKKKYCLKNNFEDNETTC
ncbi:uncharacterized protein LOC127870350 isoform X2 [Dreissena polymorpha]|uniref:uncharacterized protein LOC127870350 isoform X2 n=1 Tax=Dreissena polymorpha TaxID=45954 RepID=UPI002264E8F7|nr:uncharacterized protein LOC127870350 isoform X2 [Dreissena polymorpha]